MCTHVKITRQWKSTLRKEFELPQTLSRLFHLVSFVKCGYFSLELNSKELYQSSAKEKGSCCLVFSLSTKRKIRHVPVVDPDHQIREKGKRLSRPSDKGGGGGGAGDEKS